jgi:hypothetical protein
MRVLKPPAQLLWSPHEPTVFLAGSIDLGAADAWQARAEAALSDTDWVVLNPRRDDWDNSWAQRLDDERFRGQVEWELEGLERATRIAMYFAEGSKAPITLLELGLVARSGRLAVACAPDFWRRGNVEVVCARYGVRLFDTLEALISEIRGDGAAKSAESRTR